MMSWMIRTACIVLSTMFPAGGVGAAGQNQR